MQTNKSLFSHFNYNLPCFAYLYLKSGSPLCRTRYIVITKQKHTKIAVGVMKGKTKRNLSYQFDTITMEKHLYQKSLTVQETEGCGDITTNVTQHAQHDDCI